MITLKFEKDDRDAWLAARKTRITGSRAKDVIVKANIEKDDIIKELESLPSPVEFKKSAKKEDLIKLLPDSAAHRLKAKAMSEAEPKKGYYELIAERLWQDVESDFPDYVINETPMDRGTRLEKYAVERFRNETGKKVDDSLLIWARDENESIAISPDGVVVPIDESEATEAIECKCLNSASHVEAYLTKQIPSEYYEQGLQCMIVNDLIETVYFCFYDPRMAVIDFFIIEMRRTDVLADIVLYRDFEMSTIESVDRVCAELTGF